MPKAKPIRMPVVKDIESAPCDQGMELPSNER